MGFNDPPNKKVIQLHGARRKIPPSSIKWDEFKPTIIPDGFILLVDSREQQPLFTKTQMKKGETRIESNSILVEGDLILQCKTLHDGDYSVSGFHKQIAIELKRQSDFEKYITSEYEKKTIKKLQRLSKLRWAGLVIECSMEDLYNYPIAPSMTREKVRAHLASFDVHYGIHTYVTSNKIELELWVLDRLVRAYQYLRDGIL